MICFANMLNALLMTLWWSQKKRKVITRSPSGIQIMSISPKEWKFFKELLDMDLLFIEMSKPWKIFFDGATRQNRVGAEVIFTTLEEEVLSFTFFLIECCSNKIANGDRGWSKNEKLKMAQLREVLSSTIYQPRIHKPWFLG